MDLDDLGFDFYQNGDIYVSVKFLKVCDKVDTLYRAIPSEIKYGGKIRGKDFFIFLPGESLPVLDKTLSGSVVYRDLYNGLEIESPLYPGSVSIDRVGYVVTSENISSNYFRYKEALEMFCSEKFMLEAVHLKGVSFV